MSDSAEKVGGHMGKRSVTVVKVLLKESNDLLRFISLVLFVLRSN